MEKGLLFEATGTSLNIFDQIPESFPFEFEQSLQLFDCPIAQGLRIGTGQVSQLR